MSELGETAGAVGQGSAATGAETPKAAPGIVIGLAALPDKAVLDVGALAAVLHVAPRTVRRMVYRCELPPPVPLGGRRVWLAGRVLAHLAESAERAEREAERQAARRAQRIFPQGA
jgi:predicted DNA-binding transcriptional regulator AlpA